MLTKYRNIPVSVCYCTSNVHYGLLTLFRSCSSASHLCSVDVSKWEIFSDCLIPALSSKKNVKSFRDIMIDIEKNQWEFPLQRLFSQVTRGGYENRLL